MTDYGAPPPPPGGYQPYPSPPPATAGVAGRLGERLVRRPEPRYTVALAGLGTALALLGVLLWGADYFRKGVSADPSTSRNLLGAALAAAVTIVGYLIVVRARRGPLATAGVVASGLGLPLTIGFLTLDVTSHPMPVNVDAIFWVSLIGWLLSYLFVPGARGHTFLLFLVAAGFYDYVLIKNAADVSFRFVGTGLGTLGPRLTGLGTVAAISLVFGLAYFLIAFLLDVRGNHGPATGLIYPAFSATVVGVLAWSPDIHRGWAGVIAILVGLPVAWYGGRYGRRITCFGAAAAVTLGVVLLMSEATSDATAAGVGLLVIGALVVAAAATLAQAVREPHDMDPQATVRSR